VLDGLYSALGHVLSFFYDLIPNYGVAIILLTIFVRIILLPLTIKQTKSMQKMQRIGPEMKALQAKHKGDKQKLNEEMMKLYKEHQVNPLGGCLPLLMQFPVFIALFRVLNTCGVHVGKGKPCPANQIGTKYLPPNSGLLAAIHAQNATTMFLGMSMAATPRDVLKTGGPVAAIPYLLLLAAMGVTTWYQTKQSAAAQPPGAAASQMAIMGKIMPLMLMFFSFQFPAGVSIYWVVSNLWTIGQQRVLLGKLPKSSPLAAPPKGGGGGGSRPPKGGPKGDDDTRESARPAKGKASAATDGRAEKTAPAGKGSSGGGGTPKAEAKPKPDGNGNKPAAQGRARDNGGGAAKTGNQQQRSGGGQRPPGGQARKKKRR
jgi:YidC/Oxa1 family membrane protein insertase